uniref:protein xylosyltransferase n=1 Tax=Caenorhabditis tropicalis TaxID=1561998 RepID=A0A1I7TYM1_9PELO
MDFQDLLLFPMVLSSVNTKYRHYAFVIVLFFFLNVYLLYSAQNKAQNNEFTPDASAKIPHQPTCNITDELAISAISRATSPTCKAKLQTEACQLKNGTFSEEFPESHCSNHDNQLIDARIGCYLDSKTARVLTEFEYKFPNSNQKSTCRKNCYKAGFLYYGLEYEQECFCGNDVLKNATKVDDVECTAYRCPGDRDEFCGGFNAVEIFRTGLRNKITPLKPKYLSPQEAIPDPPVKILFLLQLNGRNERQVKRFLKSIYLPHHYYYIHVDKRQTYMFKEMEKVAEKVPNIHVTSRRFSSIWGGASLLQAFQQVVRDSLEIEQFKDWDYIFNFSESDFPILPIQDFERLITANKGKSFLASHGYNTGRFIQKQGFEFVFSECDQRMFRIGKRDFPSNLRIDGGSDWVGIHRNLAEYSISDDELPRKLRKTFESVLLPLESFYHTLAFNSKYCDDLMMSNLRLTNWYRKQGCRCASLKEIVDWCGCSPLVFRDDTRNKFEIQKAISKPTYFARKFDSMIDIESIEAAELQSIKPEKLQLSHPTYHFASANIFKSGIDEEKIHFKSLANYALQFSGSTENAARIHRIDALRAHQNSVIEIVMKVETVGGADYEFLIHRKSHFNLAENPEVSGYLLKQIVYGTKFEWKEEICREYMGFVTEKDTLHTRLQWHPTERVKKNGEKTSPEVEFKYRKGAEQLEKTVVKPYDSVFGGQFDSWNVGNRLSNLTTCDDFFVDVFAPSSDSPLATLRFPVYTEHNVKCHVDYLKQFFEIADFCSSEEACKEKIWSSTYPDPKSDIDFGYDEELKMLR